jgi:GNAT superfamily N-acetyltransferase
MLRNYRFVLFREYGLDKEKLENFVADVIIHRLKEDKAKAITAREKGGELLGLLTFSRSEWDSKHFGKPMAAFNDLIMSENVPNPRQAKKRLIMLALSNVRKEKIVHVSAKADIYDITTVHALEMANFRLMDTTVIYGFDFRKSQIPEFEDQCILRLAEPGDEEALVRVAEISFSKTRISEDRFHADPNLPQRKSDTLYVEWIRNSIREKLADAIVVAELNGAPVGFTTIENFRATALDVGVDIGALILSAVLPEARGKGVYTSMIKKGLEYLEHRVKIAELGTQISNFPVQKAWSTLGFKLASGTYALHRVLE